MQSKQLNRTHLRGIDFLTNGLWQNSKQGFLTLDKTCRFGHYATCNTTGGQSFETCIGGCRGSVQLGGLVQVFPGSVPLMLRLLGLFYLLKGPLYSQ